MQRKRRSFTKTAALVLVICITVAIACCFTACAGERYNVDYCGSKDFFQGAQDSYAAGENVTLYFDLIATDTDYSFYIDGESVNYDYDDNVGFIISFVMPEHDITLDYSMNNSMAAPEYEEDEEVLLFDYYEKIYTQEDSSGYYELTLSASLRDDLLYLDKYVKESADSEEKQTRYCVPYSAFEECTEAAERCGFETWNDSENTMSADGIYIFLEYHNWEEYICVTSQCMPEDGEQALGEIKSILESYLKDEYLI